MLLSAGGGEGMRCRVDADCAGGLACGSDLQCHSVRRAPAAEVAPPPPEYRPRGHYRSQEWQEGDPIPPGARVVKKPKLGLIIGGAVLLGVTWISDWVISFAACDRCSPNDALGLIPVLGPFIQLAVGLGEPNNVAFYIATPFLILDGLAQAGGLAMIIIGVLKGKSVLVYDSPDVQGMILPTVMPGGGMGLSAIGHF